MIRRTTRGHTADWRTKPTRVHRGAGWARSNRHKADAERRRRSARAATLMVGLPLLLVLGAALLFGDRGLWRVAGMADHRWELQRDIDEIEARNAQLQSDIQRLRSDPFTIEAIARERLGMGRKGEVVYYFQPEERPKGR